MGTSNPPKMWEYLMLANDNEDLFVDRHCLGEVFEGFMKHLRLAFRSTNYQVTLHIFRTCMFPPADRMDNIGITTLLSQTMDVRGFEK